MARKIRNRSSRNAVWSIGGSALKPCTAIYALQLLQALIKLARSRYVPFGLGLINPQQTNNMRR